MQVQVDCYFNIFSYVATNSVGEANALPFAIESLTRNVKQTNTNTTQKMKFPLRISSVNVTKSAFFFEFGHIY